MLIRIWSHVYVHLYLGWYMIVYMHYARAKSKELTYCDEATRVGHALFRERGHVIGSTLSLAHGATQCTDRQIILAHVAICLRLKDRLIDCWLHSKRTRFSHCALVCGHRNVFSVNLLCEFYSFVIEWIAANSSAQCVNTPKSPGECPPWIDDSAGNSDFYMD